jgi:hypothetical protein
VVWAGSATKVAERRRPPQDAILMMCMGQRSMCYSSRYVQSGRDM